MRRKSPIEPKDRSFAVNLMEHLVVPTFVIDATGHVVIWNKACERLTGLGAKDVLGSTEHWRAFYDAPRPCLADVLAAGRVSEISQLYLNPTVPSDLGHGLRAENWCVMPLRGQRLYLAIDAGPIYAEDGTLVAVVETVRDMTEHKNAQLALQQLASRDGLTGLANRRSFDEYLEIEWRRGMRTGEPLSLILADIDFFKRFNDHYGHVRGDECLRTVAQTMQQSMYRVSDVIARYGGEEFAVILPNTNATGALIVAHRLCNAVRSLGIAHSHSDVGASVTMSAGVATVTPDSATRPDGLIELADKALYRAKSAGRDCAVAG